MATSAASKRRPSIALPPVGALCQECMMGSDKYIPCSKPAIRIVTWNRPNAETYAMCAICADHNVSNRGARYVLQGEDYKITKTPTALEALKAANTSGTGTAAGAAGRAGRGAAGADNRSDRSINPARPAASKSSSRKPKTHNNPPSPVGDDEEFDVPPPSEDKLDLIRNLGDAQVTLKAEIADLQEKLERKAAELKTNEEVLLANAMKDAGMSSFTLTNGFHIKMDNVVRASIAKRNLEEAMEYLIANKWGGMIKREVSISIPKDDAWKKLVKQIEVALRKVNEGRKHPVEWEVSMGVHSGTLTAHVKECDREGKPVNEQLLGVFRMTRAVVAPPDTKKKDMDIPID